MYLLVDVSSITRVTKSLGSLGLSPYLPLLSNALSTARSRDSIVTTLMWSTSRTTIERKCGKKLFSNQEVVQWGELRGTTKRAYHNSELADKPVVNCLNKDNGMDAIKTRKREQGTDELY